MRVCRAILDDDVLVIGPVDPADETHWSNLLNEDPGGDS